MAVYQNPTATSSRYRPVLEVRLSSQGVLLAAGEPRYDTLDQYIEQFAAPLSSLRSIGWWTFADPMMPECRLLVQCAPEPLCDRCQQALDACACAF
jgi:hypothetical protein